VRIGLAACALGLPYSVPIAQEQEKSAIEFLKGGLQSVWAKKQADMVATPGTVQNLAAFQTILVGSSSGKPFNPATFKMQSSVDLGPRADSRYLVSFFAVISEDPRVFRPERPLGKNDRPETVALLGFDKNGTPAGLCTGTVVGPQAILTAAHCVCELGSSMAVTIGSDYAFGSGRQFTPVRVSSRIGNCADYVQAKKKKAVARLLADTGDAAVVFVGGQLPMSPARLGEPFVDGKPYRIVGYGRDQNGRDGYKASATIIALSCNPEYETKYGCRTPSEFWGAGEVGRRTGTSSDTCKGDSGGPVFLGNDNEPPSLVGITSRPVAGDFPRDCGYGGVYVRVEGEILNWINGELRPKPAPAPAAEQGGGKRKILQERIAASP
jgi:hypothetical protein